ncbi:MAG: hypothetical protein ABI972_25375 [Acidobacteriota bacterium]
MSNTFLALLEESAEAAVPATAEAMQNVTARLETIRAQWDAQAAHLNLGELAELRQRLGQLGLLIDHAARTRLGLARHMQAMESGYTANGMPPQPAARSWECTG